MKRLLLIAILLLSCHAFGVIAFVANGSGTCIQNTASTHSCTLSVTGTSNSHTVVVGCAIHVTSVSVTSITDSGSTYSMVVSKNNVSAGVRAEEWSTGINASVASTAITINTSGDSDFVCASAEYSGAASLGGNSVSVGSTPTATASTQLPSSLDNNNWAVGVIALNSATTATANNGNLRQTASSSNATIALGDNTAATAGSSITFTVNLSPTSIKSATTAELRSTTTGTPIRHKVTQS